MKSRLLTILKFLIGWPLSFVAIYFIYRTFSSQIGQVQLLTQHNYALLALAFLFFISYYITRSYIWLTLLHYQGHSLSFRESSFLWLSAQLKRYIPGNVWSFVGLAVSYNEHKVTKKDLAYAILIESELVIIVTFVLSLLTIPFLAMHFIRFPMPADQIAWILGVLFLLGILIYIFAGTWIGNKKGKVFTILRHLLSRFTPKENTILILLMAASYVFYALGYYCSIAAIVPLNPTHLLTFSGIFIFSLVAGYLSVITPTGLGVREGFIALGLSKFIPLGIAGFAALFSRIIIVISELLTLGLSYLWYKAGDKYRKQENFVSSHLHEFFLGLGILAFSLYFGIVSILRYTEYYTGRFDLGNMAQTVWNTSQGRLFMITDPNGTGVVSRLAFHADFILMLLAPFYWLWSDPRILLLIQAVVVALGAVFVYGIGRLVIKDKTLSLLFGLSYLMNPSIQRATLYDFHAVVLATTFLLGAVYFMLRKRFGLFLLFGVLAALTKEQLWFILALFGPILAVKYHLKSFGVTLFILSAGMFYYLLWHAIPDTAGSAHFALSYFSEGGSSPSDVIKHILFSPIDSLQTALMPNRIDYYRKLLEPVGYLPLAFPFWLLLAAPDLVLNIFSDRVQLQQIYYQYTAAISAFIYVSALYGVVVLRKYLPRIPYIGISIYLSVCIIAGAYLYGPLPGARESNLAVFIAPQKDRLQIDTQLKNIPREAKVSASNNLASHLSEREAIYVIPRGIGLADYVAIYKPQNYTNVEDMVTYENLLTNPFYEKYFENSQIALFRKKVTGS